MTGVVLVFERGEVLFKSGVAFKRIRYTNESSILTYKKGIYDLSKKMLELGIEPGTPAKSLFTKSSRCVLNTQAVCEEI